MLDKIYSLVKKLQSELLESRQRIVIVSHISSELSSKIISSFLNDLPYSRLLVVSSSIENAIPPRQTSVYLGEEYDCVIFDARDIFDSNSLGIVSGVLCGGGPLIILLPEIERWLLNTSNYIAHINSMLTNKSGVYYLQDLAEFTDKWETDSSGCSIIDDVELPYKSIEQKKLVKDLSNIISAADDMCAVLVSGRGRGKSSSLGMVVAELIKSGSYDIFITSPRKSIADPFFRHLIINCPDAIEVESIQIYEFSTVKFIAPDALINDKPEADLLIVDEAAAIPLPMLERLLNNYKKVIFSTTTHGYEGTGRGFVLKFYKLLDKKRANWSRMELHQPVRWGIDDYLEHWVEELLFLNNKLEEDINLPELAEDCQFEKIDRSSLITDKAKMSSLFSLLLFAHYKTTPADFQYILDDKNIRIYVLSYKNNSLGVLVINQEGQLSADLSTSIYRGERRPKGNLLAQTLCFHAGYESAAELKYARVMRIAIHPDAQKRGLGSYLLRKVIEQESDNSIDIFGSSFSSTVELLEFWRKAGLSMLRLGFSCDHITASHSAIVGVGLTNRGVNVVEQLESRFQRNFYIWVQGPLSSVETNIKNYFLRNNQRYNQRFLEIDRIDVESFVLYSRNYEACMPAISRLVAACESNLQQLSKDDYNILMVSQMYHGDWKKIVEQLHMTGKSIAISNLRSAVRHLLCIYDIRNNA